MNSGQFAIGEVKPSDLINRRRLLGAMAGGAMLPLMWGETAPSRWVPFTLSANIEVLLPRDLSKAERMRRVAATGLRAFSFWDLDDQEREMLDAQQETGLLCGSTVGSSGVGFTTGLTRPGYEQAYLDVVTRSCETARKFGAPNLVIFVGAVQEDVPWETQYRQIIQGLRKAGDIAQRFGVYLCLEPLNPIRHPNMSVLTATAGFKIIEEVDHPHVRLDFDLYHLQLGEGNLISNLRLGLRKGWIRFVEIGDVPGRLEPGTGEINYANVFRTLREEGYSGFVGMEHGSSSTPEHAIEVVRKTCEC